MARLKSILGLVGVALVLLLYFGVVFQFKAPSYEPDSKGYLDFSQEINAGTVLSKRSSPEVSISRAIRTPGYPLLLSAAEALMGGDAGRILILHTLIGAAALILLSLLVSNEVFAPFVVAAAITGVALLQSVLTKKFLV